MNKRKKQPPREAYYFAPHVSVYDTLDFDGELISPGQKVRIKNRRGTFTFRGWAHNSKADVQWLDLIEDKTGMFRTFYLDELKGIVRAKRSRKKIV